MASKGMHSLADQEEKNYIYPTSSDISDDGELAIPGPPPPPKAGESDEQREDCELMLRLSLSAI